MKQTRSRNRLLACAAIIAAATALGWLVASQPLGVQLELRSYDYRFRVKQLFPESTSIPITVLAIDEKALARIPDPLMLWQRHFAEVLNQLVAAGASVVGFDVVFSPIERYDPDGQRALVQALLQSSISNVPVILAYRVRAGGVEQPPPAIALAAAPDSFAYVNLTTDPDDFVRRQQLQQFGEDNSLRRGFALAIAASFAQRTGSALTVPGGPETVLINYMPRGTFSRVSFYDALEAARTKDSLFFRDKFRGRIVLIGRSSESGGEDLHSTPLYYSSGDNAPEGLQTPGVEIHANTIATILENRSIVESRSIHQVIIAGLMALMITVAWGYLQLRGALVATCLVYAGFSALVLAAFVRGIWLSTVAPVASGGLALMLTLGANYLLEGREKRKVRGLFQRYVSDAVITQLLEHPDEVVLRGERRKIAVLFADIRGFTTISETTAPERVVQLLNEYFGAIVEVIQSHRGTVNSLAGDGIMAIFGAPIQDDDAAFHAVEAARDMMAALQRVNEVLVERGFEPIAIGIGINSGEAIVGNMGSPRKMEYTAIGDVVNTASRIEGETRKIPDTDILISHDTYRWLDGRMPAEFVEEASLKGKELPVKLYRVPWK